MWQVRIKLLLLPQPLTCACLEECRRRKVKCDRGAPCDTCIKTKHPHCTYTPSQPPPPDSRPSRDRPTLLLAKQPTAGSLSVLDENATRAQVGSCGEKDEFGFWHPIAPEALGEPLGSSCNTDTSSRDPGSHRSSAPSSVTSSGHSHYLEGRVRQLEEQLASVRLHGPANVRQETRRKGPWVEIREGSIQKTRYFGQSHWLNGSIIGSRGMIHRLLAFKDRIDTGDPELMGLHRKLMDCKAIGRRIKARRAPDPASITSPGKHMPPRELADSLVEAYLRTFETVYRVVHVPTFRADYERYWRAPAETDEATVVLIQLCMALGAAFHDERFSLRSLAMRWLYEALFWLINPMMRDKKKMTLTGLQVQCLIHLCRHTCGPGADTSWVGAGSLLRTAMYMGLHRDPSLLVRRMPLLKAELRRRLWATVLEIALQSAIDAGGAPLVHTDDYNTRPPADLSDAQLVELATQEEANASFAGGAGAEMAVPLALAETFPTRLAIARHVNCVGIGAVPYDETLRLDAALGRAVKGAMRRILESTGGGGGGNAGNGPSPASVGAGAGSTSSAAPPFSSSGFRVRFARLMLTRTYFTLHVPILRSALRSPVFYYSRKVLLDTAFKIVANCIPPEVKHGSLAAEVAAAAKAPAPSSADYAAASPQLQQLMQDTMAARDPIGSSTGASPATTGTPFSHDGNADFYRLCLNGTGHFRSIPMQAFFVAVVELEQRAREQVESRGGGGAASSSSSSPGDQDLPSHIASLADLYGGYDGGYGDGDDDEMAQINGITATSRAWAARRMLSGEINAQGVAFGDCLTAYNRAVASGCGEDAIAAALAAAMTASVAAAHNLLLDLAEFEERANREHNGGGGGDDGGGHMSSSSAAAAATTAAAATATTTAMQGHQQTAETAPTGLVADPFDMGGGLGLGLDATGGFLMPPIIAPGFSDLDMLQGFEDNVQFGAWNFNWDDSMDLNSGFGMDF
ncbi:hypothetical protein RB595_000149 [Gaeumannomyces hyphopodioides]